MRDVVSQIGPRLRATRAAKGLTLETVATEAGMSVSTLSRLESGKRQASLELIIPLAQVLNVGLDDLVKQPPRDPRVQQHEMKREGMTIVPLTTELSQIRTYKITYHPIDDLRPLRKHEGYEWLFVLSGRLRLRLGEQDLVLTRGQAAEFDTSTPHAMSADGNRDAVIISIFNHAGERMHIHTDNTND